MNKTWIILIAAVTGSLTTQDPSARAETIPVILISPDGVTWSRNTPPTDGSLWDIVSSGDRFVAVGQMRNPRLDYDALIVTSP
jgi:hypothetical protein